MHLKSKPWLKVNHDSGLLCTVCISAQDLPVEKLQGMRFAEQWIQSGIFASGHSDSAKMTNLRIKMHRHANSSVHKKALKELSILKEDRMTVAIRKVNKKHHKTTERCFLTAYYLAKNNRPFTDYPDLLQLLELNELDVGITLHSRYSATQIINSIADDMKKNLCQSIIQNNRKISVIVDESSTISNKSTLLIYIRTIFDSAQSRNIVGSAFPLSLVELESLNAGTITEAILQCLSSNGFHSDYLSNHLVGICSDGASVMVGSQSGVLTQLKDRYPNILLWHCLCHRIELAVSDAVKSMNSVNHIQSFMDRLYSLYSQSPKAQRQLEQCATEVSSQLKKIGRVLGTRWVASSYRSLLAVWQSYPALHQHFSTAMQDVENSSTRRSMYKGLKGKW